VDEVDWRKGGRGRGGDVGGDVEGRGGWLGRGEEEGRENPFLDLFCGERAGDNDVSRERGESIERERGESIEREREREREAVMGKAGGMRRTIY
jgi:hypothetical protein